MGTRLRKLGPSRRAVGTLPFAPQPPDLSLQLFNLVLQVAQPLLAIGGPARSQPARPTARGGCALLSTAMTSSSRPPAASGANHVGDGSLFRMLPDVLMVLLLCQGNRGLTLRTRPHRWGTRPSGNRVGTPRLVQSRTQ